MELDVGAASDGSVRAKMPPWLMPTAIGPVRAKAYCTPIASMRHRELRMSLVVIGFVQRNDHARLQVVLQVLADAG